MHSWMIGFFAYWNFESVDLKWLNVKWNPCRVTHTRKRSLWIWNWLKLSVAFIMFAIMVIFWIKRFKIHRCRSEIQCVWGGICVSSMTQYRQYCNSFSTTFGLAVTKPQQMKKKERLVKMTRAFGEPQRLAVTACTQWKTTNDDYITWSILHTFRNGKLLSSCLYMQ